MVKKTIFSLFVILMFITSVFTVVGADLSDDGSGNSGSTPVISRRIVVHNCGSKTINYPPECIPPDEHNYITNTAAKSKCITILNNLPNDAFEDSKDKLDLEKPICDIDCRCTAPLKPTTPSKPPSTSSCGNRRIEGNEECDPPTVDPQDSDGFLPIEGEQKERCKQILSRSNNRKFKAENNIEMPVCDDNCKCAAYLRTYKFPCGEQEKQKIRAAINKIKQDFLKTIDTSTSTSSKKKVCSNINRITDMIKRLLQQCPDVSTSAIDDINSACSRVPTPGSGGATVSKNPFTWIIPKVIRKSFKWVTSLGCSFPSPTCAAPGDDCTILETGDILEPIGGIIDLIHKRKFKGKCSKECECLNEDQYNDDLDKAIDEALKT